MANSKSAAKRARQTPRRTIRNRTVMSRLRSLARRHASSGKPEDQRALVAALDRAAKRGIIHRNLANRRKSRLNKATAKATS
jgi:small subunit ribosomal protein S20